MIALITGQLVYKSFEHVIIDVGGVGYRVQIPLSTFYTLPDQGEVRLQIHTHVREDALLLYGFASSLEKDIFLLLLSVSGIGPKLALNILSHASAAELKEGIGSGNIKRLSALPGIGKKTAERLILELKDKMGRLDTGSLPSPLASTPVVTAGDQLEDVVSALVNLGYKESQARKTLEALEIPPDASLEQILKSALKILMR